MGKLLGFGWRCLLSPCQSDRAGRSASVSGLAMMSSETMPLFADYTADMTHKPTWGQTGARMVTTCSQHVLICSTDLSGVQDVYPQVCARVLIVCICMCVRMCQHILSKGLSVQYVCVWLMLAARVSRGGKTWVDGLVFPACRWIMTAAGLSAATGLLARTRSGFYSP